MRSVGWLHGAVVAAVVACAACAVHGDTYERTLQGISFWYGGQANMDIDLTILPGDTVIIPSRARHWHGAAPDRMMCHLALSESDESGAAADWLEPVSDADYTAATA